MSDFNLDWQQQESSKPWLCTPTLSFALANAAWSQKRDLVHNDDDQHLHLLSWWLFLQLFHSSTWHHWFPFTAMTWEVVACKVLVVAFEAACHSTFCWISVNGRRKTPEKPTCSCSAVVWACLSSGLLAVDFIWVLFLISFVSNLPSNHLCLYALHLLQ